MGAELRKAIETLQSKLGSQILSESEFAHEFLYSAVIPYLRSKIGLLADAKLARARDENRYLQEFPVPVALKYKRTLTDLFRKFHERAKEQYLSQPAMNSR